MRRSWNKVADWTVCGAGGVRRPFSVWAVGVYVWGVIAVPGEADRSWMFWRLAILFIGISALGVGLTVVGRSMPRRR